VQEEKQANKVQGSRFLDPLVPEIASGTL